MTRPFLFGGSTSGQSQNKYLVEFKAGKMTMKDKIVSADKRKGLVFINQSDDSLMHFCWKDRTTGVVEDDLIIFPDDVVFKRVPECTTGRVYVLKFKSSSRKCFYWMQEAKTDRDNEFCSKVNQYLNNPPSSSSRGGGSSGLGASTSSQLAGSLQAELSNLGDGDLQNLLNKMSQQQLIQLLGGVGGMSGMGSLSSLLGASRISSAQSGGGGSSSSDTPRVIPEASQPVVTTAPAASVTTTPAPSQSSSSSQPTSASSASSRSNPSIQLSDLQNILSGLNVPAAASSTPAAEGAQAPSVDLSSAITAEALQPLFDNKELMDRLRNLLPPAFEAAPTPSGEQVKTTLQSPQFQQALSLFSAALQSGQLGPLMQQFGMPSDVVNAANSGDMDAFVRALQSSKKASSAEGSATKDKDEDKDEDMSLD